MVFKQYHEQSAKLEKQKIENEVLQISLNDCTSINENVVYELKRLLEKETACVSLLNSRLTPDPTGMYPSCANCMYHKQQVKMVREANAQEYRHVSHFVKMSKNLRLELHDALTKEKAKNLQLKNAYDELYVMKTDPLSRDGEVARLRIELNDAKQLHLNANQTALMANRVTETLRKELQITQQRVADLEVESGNKTVRVNKLEEIVDALKRLNGMEDCSVGTCKDYLCLRRAMDFCDKEREYKAQICDLQQENAYYMNASMQYKHKAEQWSVLTGERTAVDNDIGMDEDAQVVVKRAKRVPKAILVADLTNFDELRMNLYSLFTIWSVWTDETLDGEQMLADLMFDIAPAERKQNLVSILLCCHGNSMPSGIKDSDIEISNKLVLNAFYACVRALGGVSKKHAGRTLWTNVKMNRRPIYLNS